MNDATRKKLKENKARIDDLRDQINQLQLENDALLRRDNPALCPHCGRYWPPSMMESETYPGSACDIGECIQ